MHRYGSLIKINPSAPSKLARKKDLHRKIFHCRQNFMQMDT